MKNVLLAAILALGLGACATTANPVSKDSLAKLEATYGAAASVALAYRNTCAKGAIPPSCKAIVKQIQNADNYAYNQIIVVRNFVRNNPRVDATTVTTTAWAAVTAFQNAAAGAH